VSPVSAEKDGDFVQPAAEILQALCDLGNDGDVGAEEIIDEFRDYGAAYLRNAYASR